MEIINAFFILYILPFETCTLTAGGVKRVCDKKVGILKTPL